MPSGSSWVKEGLDRPPPENARGRRGGAEYFAWAGSPLPRMWSVAGEVVRRGVLGGLHGVLALGPVGRADLAVFFKVLEGVHHAERLVHAAAEGQVVDDLVADDPCAVDKEKPAVGDAVGPRTS